VEKWTCGRATAGGAEWWDVEGAIGSGRKWDEEGKVTPAGDALVCGLRDCECCLCFLLLDFDELCFEWWIT
jgi:hypothetical protein